MGVILAKPLASGGDFNTTVTNITTPIVVDMVNTGLVLAVKWLIHIHRADDEDVKKYIEISAAHDGFTTDAVNVKYNKSAILRFGNIPNLNIDVQLNGSGINQTMDLVMTSPINAVDVHLTRTIIIK